MRHEGRILSWVVVGMSLFVTLMGMMRVLIMVLPVGSGVDGIGGDLGLGGFGLVYFDVVEVRHIGGV